MKRWGTRTRDGNTKSASGGNPPETANLPELGRLAPRSFELLHERDERVDAVFRKRVVDGRAHAADGAVPLQAVEAGGRRFLDEELLEVFVRQTECDVHERAAILV